MTGFSSLSVILLSKGELHLNMTLRSLNSKYFEFNPKIPFVLHSLETTLIKQFKSKLLRGNISFNLQINNQNLLAGSIEPDFNVLTQYINSINKIEKEYNLPGNLELKDILRLPNIFLNKDNTSNNIAKEISSDLFKAIDNLINSLIEERLKEGSALAKDIFNRIEVITKYINQLEPRSLIVIDQKKAVITEALKKITSTITDKAFNNTNISNTNISEYIALAIYNQLDKIDIHEEIIRFKSHINSLIYLLEADLIEKGKKIDFILQELFREINTIAAKCSDSEISNLAINIKVEIEKAREQAQNIV